MGLYLGNSKKKFCLKNSSYSPVYYTPIYNWVPYAIDTDGELYQGTGYITGYRLNSSGGLTAQENTVSTGFIPCKATDVIRLGGIDWEPGPINGYCYISFFDTEFSLLGTANVYVPTTYVKNNFYGGIVSGNNYTIENGVTTFKPIFKDSSNVAYFRICGWGEGSKMIVTINTEIK